MKTPSLLMIFTASFSLYAFANSIAPAHAQFGGLLGKKDKEETKKQSDFGSLDVSSPIEQLAEEDISKSKTIGQVVGGIALGYACYKKTSNSFLISTCVAAGTKGGDLMGEYLGKAIAIRRLTYANEHEFLESEIEAAESAIETREAALKKTKSEIEQASVRTKELAAKSELTATEIKEAKKIKAETDAKLKESKLLAQRYKDTLDYLDSTLETSKSKIESLDEDKKEAQKSYNELASKRDSLASLLANVQITIDKLESDNAVMENLLAS